METIMVLLLTIWLGNGDITTKAVMSRNLDPVACDAFAGNIGLAIMGQKIKVEGEAEDQLVKYIAHSCVLQTKGSDA